MLLGPVLFMEDIHHALANNLKAIREKEKLSLEKLSQLSGVSKTMIGQIERGESIRFRADRPHTYYNAGEMMTRLSVTIYYPAY